MARRPVLAPRAASVAVRRRGEGAAMTWTVTVAAVETSGDLAASTRRSADAYRAYRRRLEDGAPGIDPVPVSYREIERSGADAADSAPDALADVADALAERRRLLREGLPVHGALLRTIRTRVVEGRLVLAAPAPGIVPLVGILREHLDDGVRVDALRGSDDDPERVAAFLGADGPALLVTAPSALAAGPSLPASTPLLVAGTALTAPGVLDRLGAAVDLGDRDALRALVGVPADADERLSGADGRAFLEAAARLRASAHDHGQHVRFDAAGGTAGAAAIALERDGAAWIRRLLDVGRFTWPSGRGTRAALRAFLVSVDGDGRSGVLGRWTPATAGGPSEDATGEPDADLPARIPDPERTDHDDTSGAEASERDDDGSLSGIHRSTRRRGRYETRRRTARRSWRYYEPDAGESDPVSLDAIEAAIEDDGTAASRASGRPADEDLLEELRDLAGVLGRAPGRADVKKFGTRSPRAYVEGFGSWESALEAAGIGDEEADRGRRGGVLARSVEAAFRGLSSS